MQRTLGIDGQVSITAAEYVELVRQNDKIAALAKTLQKEIDGMTAYMEGTDVRINIKQIAEALDIDLNYPHKVDK